MESNKQWQLLNFISERSQINVTCTIVQLPPASPNFSLTTFRRAAADSSRHVTIQTENYSFLLQLHTNTVHTSPLQVDESHFNCFTAKN